MMIIIIMGVCGCGKTTVGLELAETLKWQIADGDEFHTDSNKRKMSRGEPLTDQDRYPWLYNIHQFIKGLQLSGISCVVTCSALKKSYRNILTTGEEPADYHITGEVDTDCHTAGQAPTDCHISDKTKQKTSNAGCLQHREPEISNLISDVSHNSKQQSHDLQNKSHDMQIRSADLNGSPSIVFVHLTGSEAILRQRMSKREGHFMPASLLTSQLKTLEVPGPEELCISVDVDKSVHGVVTEIIARLGLQSI